MDHKRSFAVAVLAVLTLASGAYAQPSIMDQRWSVDVGLGWDNGISGNINSSGIGTLNGQTAVVLANSYERVYGTGVNLRFGGGFLIDEVTEVRGMFIYQSMNAELVQMGNIGVAPLYAQYDPYKSFALDFGFRRYVDFKPSVRGYAEATLGIGFINETDVLLAAPTAQLAKDATDFYDRTAAMTLGGDVGVLVQASPTVGVYFQTGLRFMSGMSAVDGLQGTGLEKINDSSSRWVMPIVFGIRARF